MTTAAMTSGWYYAKGGDPSGQSTGPLSWEQFYALAQAGTLAPDDPVWHQTFPGWLPAAQVPGLFLAAAAPAVQAPSPAPGQAAVAYGQATQPAAALSTGRRRSWLYWAVPLVVLILVGAGLGAYFGFLRGGEGTSSTVSSNTTRAMSETTTSTTEAPNTWTNLNPAGSLPSARAYQSMVYDSTTGKVILFGAWGVGFIFLNDTWSYDPVANTWTELNPGSSLPSARSAAAMVYDSSSGMAVLFGGWEHISFNDTWAYGVTP